MAEVPQKLAPFLTRCKLGDAALSRVAERFARRQSEGKLPLDAAALNFALRAEGSPYVWPRAWTLEGDEPASSESVARLQAWLDQGRDSGNRRCGVALAATAERQVLAAVAIDALADLQPVPMRARAGTWIDINASMLVPTSEAKVLLLPPGGAPYSLPTSFDGRRVRARFRVDRPGQFLVQVLAHVDGGPRPVLEATVYADVAPSRSFFGDAAPGEPLEPLPRGANPSEALLDMVNRARAGVASSPLVRSSRLDHVAQKHAEAMRERKRVAHDVGEGDPESRVDQAGINFLATGENVAHALDITRAHRALWASPSHRGNLLEPRFDQVGIGVAPDPDGSVWVCQVFADLPEPAGKPP